MSGPEGTRMIQTYRPSVEDVDGWGLAGAEPDHR